MARGALHRSLPPDSQCSARRGIRETSGRRHGAQPATDESGAEAIASPGRIDLVDLERGLREAGRQVEVAGALGAPLLNDRANATAEDFRNRKEALALRLPITLDSSRGIEGFRNKFPPPSPN